MIAIASIKSNVSRRVGYCNRLLLGSIALLSISEDEWVATYHPDTLLEQYKKRKHTHEQYRVTTVRLVADGFSGAVPHFCRSIVLDDTVSRSTPRLDKSHGLRRWRLLRLLDRAKNPCWASLF